MKHLTFLLPLVALLLDSPVAATYSYFESEHLKPCPTLKPDTNLDISKLGGRWQLSLLILDAANEDLEEKDSCVTGEVSLLNSTHMRQLWDMFTPYIENEPTATVELLTESLKPGVWSVHTPLGGNLSATVFESGPGHVLVTHCDWHRGTLVHLWTAGVTRSRLQPRDRVKLSKALIKAGFHPSQTKIITWSNC